MRFLTNGYCIAFRFARRDVSPRSELFRRDPRLALRRGYSPLYVENNEILPTASLKLIAIWQDVHLPVQTFT